MLLLCLREIKVNVMKIRVPGPRGRVTALKGQNKLGLKVFGKVNGVLLAAGMPHRILCPAMNPET
jgi:hypothetical protein